MCCEDTTDQHILSDAVLQVGWSGHFSAMLSPYLKYGRFVSRRQPGASFVVQRVLSTENNYCYLFLLILCVYAKLVRDHWEGQKRPRFFQSLFVSCSNRPRLRVLVFQAALPVEGTS